MKKRKRPKYWWDWGIIFWRNWPDQKAKHMLTGKIGKVIGERGSTNGGITKLLLRWEDNTEEWVHPRLLGQVKNQSIKEMENDEGKI